MCALAYTHKLTVSQSINTEEEKLSSLIPRKATSHVRFGRASQTLRELILGFAAFKRK